MYNYSRLYQVWTAYEKSLENGYKSLPLVDDINFGLLTSEVSTAIILCYCITLIFFLYNLGRMEFDS